MVRLQSSARWRRYGAAASLATIAALAGSTPANATDGGPDADTLAKTLHATVPMAGAAVDQVETAVPAAAPVTSRLRSGIAAAGSRTPVRSTVAAVRAPISEVAVRAQPAVAAVTQRADDLAPDQTTAGIGRPTFAPRAAGAIDRRASRDAGRPTLAVAQVPELGATPYLSASDGVALFAATEQARSNASSTTANGDDSGPDRDLPPLGHEGGSTLLGGPAGIALIALGLLAALLTLIPRFSSRLLRMSPARWGPVAFLVPIERPG
jgi:hypothetical protein